MEDERFHWADYLVFGLSLLISMGIGVWFACTGKKASTTDEFLMAGRNMPVFPVSMSMFVSWLSAISFLGDPVEVYTYGSIYIFLGVGYVLSLPVIAQFFAPQYHKMRLISVYQFLEQKYNKWIRLLGAVLCIVITESWLAIVLYAPSLALSQVSGIPVWTSILSIGLICTFYTTIGGMKAVLWADTVQMIIMVAGQLAVVIQGCIRLGGIDKVWQIASEGGRLNMVNFDPNPFLRASFWTGLVGGFFRVLNPYVGTQFLVQRYNTVKTPHQAKLVVLWNFPMFVLLVVLFWIIGLVMYAVYHDCDPVSDNQIALADQMVPLLVIRLLSFMPGIPGLFIACVFSASLSSLSSGFNGSAAVVLTDFVVPLYRRFTKKDMSDSKQTAVSKGLAVVFGLVTVALSFLIMAVGTSIFATTAKITGMFGGPLGAVFVCGLLLPKLSNASVMSGFVCSLVLSIWTGIGGVFVQPRWTKLPVSTEGCLSHNSSLVILNTTMSDVTTNAFDYNFTTSSLTNTTLDGSSDSGHSFSLNDMYSLSPLIYGPFSTMIGVVLAILFHFIIAQGSKLCCRSKYKSLKAVQRQSSLIGYTYEESTELSSQSSRRPASRQFKGDPRSPSGLQQSEIRGLAHNTAV